MRYRAFKRKKDSLFYFQFLSEDSNVLLNSQSYTDKDTCFNGIRSVIANAAKGDNYEKSIDGNDNHFFILKASNGEEIGRSTKYNTEDELDEAIGNFINEAPSASSKAPESNEDTEATNEEKPYAEKEGGEDDYRPLAFYEERIAGLENGFDKFDADKGEGEYYFTYNLDGNVVLISEGYKTEKSRDKGIASANKNLSNPESYQKEVHPNGKHYFNLIAKNKQELATSRWFDSENETDQMISSLQNQNSDDNSKKEKVAPKKSKPERTYISKKQPYLCNNITYDTFQSGGNQKYYFVFKDKDDKAVLINGNVRGFETQEDLDAGIKSVLEYGSKKDNYEIKTAKNGKTYFYIQDDDGKNIARSSLFFGTEEELKAAMTLVQCVDATMVSAALAPAAKSPAENNIDDYLPAENYTSDGPGFHKFFDQDKNEYYFSYNDRNGNVLLRSEGYTTEKARDNGIASVTKNGPLEKRWKTDTVLDGKYHYYALRAGNNHEIGRSRYFDERHEMIQVLAQAKEMLTPASERLSAAAIPTEPEAISDDYLPCTDYAGENGFHTFTNTENGEHYFSFNRSSDGKTLLRSEGYTQTSARDNGIQSVIKNAPIEERWNTGDTLNGKYHYYLLKAGNHKEIARSCYYEDEAIMLADLAWLKGEDSPIGVGSALVGGALMSAALLRTKEEEDSAALAAVAAEEAAKKKEEEEIAAAALAATAAAEAAAKKKADEEAAAALAANAEALRLKKEEEDKAAALAAAAAAATATMQNEEDNKAQAAAAAYTENENKSGCMKWLLPLLLALLLIAALLFFMRSCEGCNSLFGGTDDTESNEGGHTDNNNSDVSGEDVDSTDIGNGGEDVTPENYGRDGDAMGFEPGTLPYYMANFLSSAESSFPSTSFDADAVKFRKNSDRLNTAAKRQLNDVIALLKEYPNARIDIYGYVIENETGSGNKETSLDDDRARAIYDYLRDGGIDESRMNFQGDGLGDSRSGAIRILSR